MGLLKGRQGEHQVELMGSCGAPGARKVATAPASSPWQGRVCHAICRPGPRGDVLSGGGGGDSEKTRWDPKPIQSTSADGVLGVGSFSPEA